MRDPKILRNNRDFQAVYSRGKSLGSHYLVFLYRANNCGYNRRAFLASKKVGNAVERNRARRLMKEAYRLILAKNPYLDFEVSAGESGNSRRIVKKTYDMIFVARNSILSAGCRDVEKAMVYLLKKSGILLPEGDNPQRYTSEKDSNIGDRKK